MSPSPRLADQAVQRRVIALCMAGVLLLSLALAWAVSREQRIDLEGMSLALPVGWSATEPPAHEKGFSKVVQYGQRDPHGNSTRRLVVARLNDALAGDPDAAFDAVVGELTGRWSVLLGQSRRRLKAGETSATELRLMGMNRDLSRRQDRLHLLSLVSSEDHRLWAIYMEEIRVISGPLAQTVIPQTMLQRFDRLMNGLRLEPVVKKQRARP